jgi:hypothetical protein
VSSIIQAVLAFLTLVCIFGIPLLMCREMIKRTKTAYKTSLLVMAEKLYSEIRLLSQSPIGTEKQINSKTQKLEGLQKQLGVVNSLIQEIDKIPDWPGTMVSGVQVVGGFVFSTFSPMAIDWLKSKLMG